MEGWYSIDEITSSIGSMEYILFWTVVSSAYIIPIEYDVTTFHNVVWDPRQIPADTQLKKSFIYFFLAGDFMGDDTTRARHDIWKEEKWSAFWRQYVPLIPLYNWTGCNTKGVYYAIDTIRYGDPLWDIGVLDLTTWHPQRWDTHFVYNNLIIREVMGPYMFRISEFDETAW